jgi:hypothetical protein
MGKKDVKATKVEKPAKVEKAEKPKKADKKEKAAKAAPVEVCTAIPFDLCRSRLGQRL